MLRAIVSTDINLPCPLAFPTMRQFRFIFTALITLLFVINAAFSRKAISVLLCGILSFNSISCYSFLNQVDAANAQTAPPAGKLDLTGIWIARNTAFRFDKNGCSFAAGQYAIQPVEVNLTQRGNELIFSSSSITRSKGTVSGNAFNLISVTNDPHGMFTIESVGNITNDGNKITGEASCKGSPGSATSKGGFTWIRKNLTSQATSKEAYVGSASHYEFQLVSKAGMLVDGQTLVDPGATANGLGLIDGHFQGEYTRRIIDDNGHIAYYDNDRLFFDNKAIAFKGKNINNFVIVRVVSFFLFKNGTLDVLADVFDTQKRRNTTIIIRNERVLFDFANSSGSVSPIIYPECTLNLNMHGCTANAYYTYIYYKNYFRFDTNGFKEVSIQEAEKRMLSSPDIAESKTTQKAQCVGNTKNQTICSLTDPSGLIVRDDNKVFPSGCCGYVLNNNGKILNLNELKVLDYDKDALPTNSQLSSQDLQNASKLYDLKVPYDKLLGIPQNVEWKYLRHRVVQLSDNGDIAIIVQSQLRDPVDEKKSFNASAIIRATLSGTTIAKAEPNQCPRFQTMLSETKDIRKLADTLEKDDQAYSAAVIDIVRRGYNSPYAVYMLDVPWEEIPELFKDETRIRAERSQIVSRVRTKADNRERFASIGINGKFIPQAPIYAKENIELFCSLDSSKFTKEFWNSLWMAGYIDYELYTQTEKLLIAYDRKGWFQAVAAFSGAIAAYSGVPYLYSFAVRGTEFIWTNLSGKAIQKLEKKELPETVTSVEIESAGLPKPLTKIEKGMEVDPTKYQVFRGGESFKLKPNEARIDKSTGLVKPGYGVSLNSNPTAEALANRGGIYQIESVSNDLKIVQQGDKLTHFVISPRELMSPERYQELLNQVKVFR